MQETSTVDEGSISKRSSLTYSDYHRNKLKRKRKNSRRVSTSNNPTIISFGLLCTKQYLNNKFNILRLIVLIITSVLLFVCILYGFGSVLTLELEEFWCEEYTWDEIVQHNQANNQSHGVPGCYRQRVLDFQFDTVFSTDVNDNGLSVAKHVYFLSVIKSILFFTISLILLCLLIFHTLACITDCKTTVLGHWYVLVSFFNFICRMRRTHVFFVFHIPYFFFLYFLYFVFFKFDCVRNRLDTRRRKRADIVSSRSSDHCCVGDDIFWEERLPLKLWNLYISIVNLMQKMSLLDSPASILMIQIKETVEVCVQS